MLESAGCSINQQHEDIILENIKSNPLAKGIKNWRNRKEQLQTLVSRLPAASAGPLVGAEGQLCSN
jgi:hypothetical protein